MSGDIYGCHDCGAPGIEWEVECGPDLTLPISVGEPLALLWSCVVFQAMPTPAMARTDGRGGWLRVVGISGVGWQSTLPCICTWDGDREAWE